MTIFKNGCDFFISKYVADNGFNLLFEVLMVLQPQLTLQGKAEITMSVYKESELGKF